MKAKGPRAPRDSMAPFALRDGRVFLEDVALDELVAQLEGRPARLISRAVLDAVLSAGPQCISFAALEDPDVLKLAAAAGWWLRAYSRHELALALEFEFPAEHLIACGPVVDDGFVKEALLAGVASFELSEREVANAVRIAKWLQLELPSASTTIPPSAPDTVFGNSAAFLSAVLCQPPELNLDMAWPLGLEPLTHASSPLPLLIAAVRPPVQIGNPQQVFVRCLSRGSGDAAPQAAHLHGEVRRGDWVALPSAAAVQRAWIDPVHEPVQALLVSERSWRTLLPRNLPPRETE